MALSTIYGACGALSTMYAALALDRKGMWVVWRCRRLKEATGRLVVAWVLASACLTGHLAHLWKGAPAWLHLLGRPPVHAAMSALALMGQHPLLLPSLPFLPLPSCLSAPATPITANCIAEELTGLPTKCNVVSTCHHVAGWRLVM